MAAGTGSRNAAPILSVRPGPGYAVEMRIALFLAGMILSLAAESQEIYRWVDKDGIVHYADQPGAPDAERIELVGLSTYEAEASSAESGEPEPPPSVGPIYGSPSIFAPHAVGAFFRAGSARAGPA